MIRQGFDEGLVNQARIVGRIELVDHDVQRRSVHAQRCQRRKVLEQLLGAPVKLAGSQHRDGFVLGNQLVGFRRGLRCPDDKTKTTGVRIEVDGQGAEIGVGAEGAQVCGYRGLARAAFGREDRCDFEGACLKID